MESAINKTLIIRLSSIGDVVLASPLIRLLRKNLPKGQIDFLVKKEYAELVRYNSNLSNIIELDSHEGLRHLEELRNRIRETGYDFIADLQGSLRSSLLRFGNGKRIRVVNKRRIARFLLVNFKWNVYSSTPPISRRYLETVEALGIEDDGLGLEVHVPQEIRDRVLDGIQGDGFGGTSEVVGLCPGSRHATKRWLSDRYAELAFRLISEDRVTVLLFGGKADRELCGEIERHVASKTGGSASLKNLAGPFSLLETAAAMDVCNVIVANDTGLLHLAEARKRKVVGIYGSTVEEFGFFPYGTKSKVVERRGLYCRPCSHIGRDSCPEGHFRCMKEIGVDEVLDSVRSFATIAA